MNELFESLKKETFVQEAITKFGEVKIRKVFDRAWDFGHANGDSEVKNWFFDFIDILNC